jgi:hypothetical protein
MTPFQKRWIDEAGYADLIAKVREESPTSEWFQGECGEYLFSALRSRVERLVEQESHEFQFLTSSSASDHEQIYLRA